MFFPYAAVLILFLGVVSPSTSASNEAFASGRVNFYLNRQNRNEQTISTVACEKNFDSHLPTVIFIHGYQGDHNGDAAQTVKNAFLSVKDINVILVDYKFYNSPYMRLYGFYKDIGRTTGSLINFLTSNCQLPLSSVTIIGHSFGAHISAIAANFVQGQVERIIGLDPAGPVFRDVGPEDRLSADDAAYVGCLHTSPTLGISESICQVNYYMNGGQLQPSCNNSIGDAEVLFGTCSHNAPMAYLADAVKGTKKYPASVCISSYDAKHNNVCSRGSGGYVEFSLENRPYLPGSYYVAIP